jgi:nucleotide-binding universal stress UspA family protein
MKVLYATDGSDAAKASGRLLLELADPAKVEVTVLSVDAPVVSGDDCAAQEVAEEAAEVFEMRGFRVQVQTAQGHPGLAISRIAREGFDLTVIGAGSTTRLGRALLGSVSGYLSRAAPTAVLMSRSPDQRKPG